MTFAGERRRGDRHSDPSDAAAAEVLCLLPADLAPSLLEPLQDQLAGDDRAGVLVEQRSADRRSGSERRQTDEGPPPGTGERRKIRNAGGRRVGERRAALIALDDPPPLPGEAQRHARRIRFVQRIEQQAEKLEDLDTARLVTHFQAGDEDAFAAIYSRYFDRVYGYLRVLLKDQHEAEDMAQQVFMQVFQALPKYERRTQPFRAWLFIVVRNRAIQQIRKAERVDPVDPGELLRDVPAEEVPLPVLGWISDKDLLLFVERLPLAQRQVLALRFMLGMDTKEIAEVMGRTTTDVRGLQHRALTFLRQRLRAVGRERRGGRIRMRRRFQQAPVLRFRRFALKP